MMTKHVPLRVLVVDDNAQASQGLAALIALDGHAVHCVQDASLALSEARAFAPDVILLDLALPGTSGYEVLRLMRADSQLRHARIAAVTGYAQESDRKRALESGFDEHLVKPVDEAALERLLTRR
jgi:two-component system CheB/CheR fusion protein